MAPRIGVLALQGDVREHLAALESLGAQALPVKSPGELAELEGLIIPGGESTVIDKLSRMYGVAEVLKARIADGFPVYGSCAGMIMLADTIADLQAALRRAPKGDRSDEGGNRSRRDHRGPRDHGPRGRGPGGRGPHGRRGPRRSGRGR